MSSDYPYSLELRVSGDQSSLETAYRSLVPELMNTDRTSVELIHEDGKLLLTISTQDSTALRAAMNSYLRWLNEALDVVDTTRK